MVRFQCIHCGGRIAVQKRHMNRLARCPECGNVTHPFAAHLEKKPAAAEAQLAPTASKSRKSEKIPPAVQTPLCDNCGQPLGKLQKPLTWKKHQVCAPCHHALSLEKQGDNPNSSTTAIVSRPKAELDFVDANPPASRLLGGSGIRRQFAVSDFTLAFWGACLGLCTTAIVIYLIIRILDSLSTLFIWALVAGGLVIAWFWIKRGLRALRFPEKVKQVKAIVRDARD